VAMIAAETEEQARRFAADAGPGAEWENPSKYSCARSEGSKPHVVGDVAFQSIPPQREKGKRPHAESASKPIRA
jgi:hypothetical protein